MTHGNIITLILASWLVACNASTPASDDQAPSAANPSIPAVTPAELPPDAAPGQVDDASQAQSVRSSQDNLGDAAMLRNSFDECIQASGGVTPEMQGCIETEFEYQDARLNQAYQSLLARSTGDQKAKRESEQTQWRSERDSWCGWDAKEGGQAQRLEANDCFLNMTAERATALEAR